MIELTVKTMDSQNHQFSVEDDITVEQFKAHIADKVNIPAATQRIIYCGRVLQDTAKLTDYDVGGKVVHLVQRAPPSSTARSNHSVTPPPEPNRPRDGFRGFERVGNTVYMGMGSMTFPNNFMEAQGIVPPRATHTLSASRLNVARRMLRCAENVISQLENPSSTNEQPAPEEPAEEEMTPVIEARVIVPGSSDQPIDENAVISAVENSIFNVASGVVNLDQNAGPSSSATGQSTETGGQRSDSSTPESSTPRSSSNENLTTENNGEPPREGLRPSRMRCRGPEMAELLTILNELQVRFAPFLARYQSFMRDDPQVSAEDLPQTRQMLKRVSRVLHYFGHAYHSLSDIMISVDQPPPRLLHCRPILIQHSAVVQAGIPIQVEAQINLSADRPTATPGSTTTSTTGTAANTTATDGANRTPSSTTTNNSHPNGPSITVQPGFVGLPFMPAGSMRVITTPVEIRTVRANPPRPRPNNNNNTPTTTPSAPPSTNTPSAPQAPPTGADGQPQPGQQLGGPLGNNGNVEFFMEVTREGITIDSLESALGGSNPNANELFRGGDLIQSLMQLVNSQLANRGGQPGQPQQQHAQTPPSTADSSQQGQPGNALSQNSQARGNTQTNPTTATHTRSTPRPHVHMTQQAVQGGFDPFLPCYSHHVASSRGQRIVSMGPPNRQEPAMPRENASATSQPSNAPIAQTNQQAPPQGGANAQPDLRNLAAQVEDIIRSLPGNMANMANLIGANQSATRAAEAVMHAMRNGMGGAPVAGQQQAPPQRGAPDGTPSPGPHTPPAFAFIGNLMGENLPDLLSGGPTLDQFLQSFHQEEPYVQGDSLLMDLVMLLLRNLRLNDLFMINSGNMAPLNRQMETVQEFFRTEVCQNDYSTEEGIQRGSERIMNDLRPLIDSFAAVPARDDIDIVGSIEGFFRQRLPAIINMAINCSTRPNTATQSPMLTLIWRTAKELLALALHCSANGQQGVETVFEEVMSRTMTDIPADIHSWTISNSRTALRAIIGNLDVRPADVELYVVHKTEGSTNVAPQRVDEEEVRPPQQEGRKENPADVESMEVDFDATPTNAGPVLDTAPIRVEEAEPLPNVIWGSESWHRQTPEDWVPIITRDVQKQRRQNSQPAFSDAYLSGMPSKRRKIINNSKPQGSLPQVITESVRQAVTATGLTSTAPLDTVSQAAGQSSDIQAAYRTLLRTTVQANLRDNEDFTAERYPNASNYFNGSPPE